MLLMLLGMVASPSRAESDDTFTPYVRGQYGYDSNLFRLQDDQAALATLGTTDTSDSYYRLGVGIDMNLRISRQLIVGHAEFNQTRFNKYKGLNYDGHDTSLQWNWLVGSFVTGDLGIAETLTQGSFVETKQPINNLMKTRRIFLNAAFNPEHSWQPKFGLERSTVRNDASIQQTLDTTVDTASMGLQYETEKGTQIEWLTQRSDGKSPVPQTVSQTTVKNDYQQWDNGVRTYWSPTFKTQLNGRLNYTERRYADIPQRNFSGVTGRVALNYDVTDKTTLKSALYREIGAVTYPTASYAVDEGILLGVTWNPTVKVASYMQVSRDRIDYAGDPGFVLSSAPARQDRLRALQAGINYQVLRNTAVGLALQRGVVDSNQALKSYDYHSAMFSLRSEF